MSSGSARRLPAILAALLAGILSASPNARGVLYDLPNVVAGADALSAPDIAGRCEIVAGDFFETVPADGDAYLLSRVIHDWDDDAALTILVNCRRRMGFDGHLLLFEVVSKPPNEPDPNKFFDVWFIDGGGRERTEAEYRTLLHRAGFTLARVVSTGSASAILEGHPV